MFVYDCVCVCVSSRYRPVPVEIRRPLRRIVDCDERCFRCRTGILIPLPFILLNATTFFPIVQLRSFTSEGFAFKRLPLACKNFKF